MFNQHQISRSRFIKTLPIPIPIPIPIPSTILVMPMSTSCFVCFRFILGNHSSSSDRIAAAAYNEDEATSLFDLKNGVITRFTWSQMEKFTSVFSQVIGFGGFSTVYLAQLPDSSLAAVKIYGGNSHRLSCIYKQELGILLSLRHDNIVKFIGYSHNQEEEESALVFEYLSNGNLQEKLHHKQEGAVIPWRNRTAIAFQLAEAIEYLHHKCTLPVIHGDIKASNILLDQQLNCKLCDFGSAKMGFSSTVLPSSKAGRMMMLGSPGYTDPHYLRTGISSKKNDIYSFGVIVLELITGMEAVSSHTGERLTSVAGPLLKDLSESNMAKLVDPCLKMGGGFDLEEVKAMASISAMCLSDFRPSASDIVNTMRNTMSFSNTSSAISPHKL